MIEVDSIQVDETLLSLLGDISTKKWFYERLKRLCHIDDLLSTIQEIVSRGVCTGHSKQNRGISPELIVNEIDNLAFTVADGGGRKHRIEISLPSDYPAQAPHFSSSLPFPITFDWHTRCTLKSILDIVSSRGAADMSMRYYWCVVFISILLFRSPIYGGSIASEQFCSDDVPDIPTRCQPTRTPTPLPSVQPTAAPTLLPSVSSRPTPEPTATPYVCPSISFQPTTGPKGMTVGGVAGLIVGAVSLLLPMVIMNLP